jgi:twinkle protein
MFDDKRQPKMAHRLFADSLYWAADHFFLIRHPDMADEAPPEPPSLEPQQQPLGVQGVEAVGPQHVAGGQAGWSPASGGVGEGAEGARRAAAADAAEAAERFAAEARRPCDIDWILEKATLAVLRCALSCD